MTYIYTLRYMAGAREWAATWATWLVGLEPGQVAIRRRC